jgi:hypothetical protein
MGGMWDRNLEKQAGHSIQFQNKEGKIFNLIDVVIFPEDSRLSYKDNITADKTKISNKIKKIGEKDPMQNDIEHFLKSKNITSSKIINNPAGNSSAMVVVVGQSEKPEIAYIKYFRQKRSSRPPIFWKTSHFQNETGLTQIGNVKSATARAAELRIGPDDFVEPGIKHNVLDIPKIIENKLKTRNDLPEELKKGLPAMLNNLITKPKTPVPGIEKYKDTIAVVFGEIASPIALSLNLSTRGSYADAQKNLLGPLGVTWGDFKQVEYGAKNQKLSDSYLYAGDVKLVVSSKARQGSPASIITAIETLEKYPKEFGANFQKKYQNFLPLLKLLANNDAITGVLKSAIIKKLITQEEADYITSIYGKNIKRVNLNTFPNLPRVNLAKPKVDRANPKFDIGYHLLGCVAKELKINLNADKDLLTEFFKAVLNKSTMVQVYTRIDGNEKGLWFSAFDVIWPPVFEGRIEVESDHYTSNARPSKKFGFQFK